MRQEHLCIGKNGEYIMPPCDLQCRYCFRKFTWRKSRACHEARCPSLLKIPNCTKHYRKSIEHIKGRLVLALNGHPLNAGKIKRLIEFCNDSLSVRP